jgi:hypothetical protein
MHCGEEQEDVSLDEVERLDAAARESSAVVACRNVCTSIQKLRFSFAYSS